MFGNKDRKAVAIQTLIGSDTRIEGDLRFEGGCHIDGLVNGGINGGNDPEACLSVSEEGRVQGNVSVPRLALSGTVEGDVVVSERAELGPTARVTGNVHYNLIEITAGAEINGQLIHETPTVKSAARTELRKSGDQAMAEAQLDGAAKQSS
jgi:cytoskeletal protein CcmA (bactofilin family)